jgi:transketolase
LVGDIERGGYVLRDCKGTPQAIIIATGSEVELALNAYEELTADGQRVRVVSMPSSDVFDAQDAAYRESVLPAACTARVAVEAGVTAGWRQYVGLNGAVIGVDTFGESAPAADLYKHFGITTAAVSDAVRKLL